MNDKPNELMTDAEFYLDRITYYSIAANESNNTCGFGEIPFTIDKAGHEKTLDFWKEAFVQYMNIRVRKDVKAEEELKALKKQKAWDRKMEKILDRTTKE